MIFLNNSNEIADYLIKEKIVLMQTDTIFGLLCRGDNIDCITRIEEIKHRDHPAFGFFVKNIEMAERYVKINKLQRHIFKILFPGYFTLIFEAKNNYFLIDNEAKITMNKNVGKIPERCFGKNEKDIKTLGIRVPNNPMCLEVLQKVNFPILATSANISKQPSPTTFESINESILNSVDAIYYDKNFKIANLNSTIIDLSNFNENKNDIKIIRQGSGELQKIYSLFDNLTF